MNTLYAGPPVVAYYAAQITDWQPAPAPTFACTMALTEERIRAIIREELERLLVPKRKRVKRK